MKINMTFEFNDENRQAIAAHYGKKGKASRETIRTSIDALVTAWMEDVMMDAETAREDAREE